MSTTNNNHTQTQALLVSLSFTLCRQSRQSKKEAKRSEDANQAHRGVCKSSYFYFEEEVAGEKHDALSEIKSYQNEWRSAHNRLTRPWDGENVRVLPAALANEYMEMDSRYREGYPAVQQGFYEVHPDWQTTGPHRMGGLYDPTDFPGLDECRKSIGFEVRIIPLPDGEAWRRVNLLSPEFAATREAETNERIAKAVAESQKQTWIDLLKPVEHIVETLSKDKSRIFNSLIGNLTDILTLAPAFNMGGDVEMNQFIAEAKATLAVINPDDLRADIDVRKSTCKKAEELLAKFGQLGQRKFA